MKLGDGAFDSAMTLCTSWLLSQFLRPTEARSGMKFCEEVVPNQFYGRKGEVPELLGSYGFTKL